jgi:hypothetical protein
VDGRQIVPTSWIRAMLQPRLKTDWSAGYGYHSYLETIAGHRLVAGTGNGGQRLIVLPARTKPQSEGAVGALAHEPDPEGRTGVRRLTSAGGPSSRVGASPTRH